MLFRLQTAVRPQLYSNLLQPVRQSKNLFPIASQFHTAIVQRQAEEVDEYAHKGSVQYKLRGKVNNKKFL